MNVFLLIAVVVISLGCLASLIALLIYSGKKVEEHRKQCSDWLCKLHSFGLNLIGLIAVGKVLYHMGNPLHNFGQPMDYAYQGWMLWWLVGILAWTAVIIVMELIRAFIRDMRAKTA